MQFGSADLSSVIISFCNDLPATNPWRKEEWGQTGRSKIASKNEKKERKNGGKPAHQKLQQKNEKKRERKNGGKPADQKLQQKK